MANPLPPAWLSDIRAFEKEWAVLRECVSVRPDTESLVKSFPLIDWSRLLLLAEEHGVLGHLAERLMDRSLGAVPHEARQRILELRRVQSFQTLRLSGELFRLLELFAGQGISALVIKGPVLEVQAYGNLRLRTYGDIDLLVRQRDIRRATLALIAEGYEPAVSLESIDAGKIPGQYLFFKPDSHLLVELHNDLTLRYFPRPLPIEGYFARQVRVRVDNHEVSAPSVEDELLLVCVHGAKHLWEKLCWIADVAGLVSRHTNLDWERANVCARTVRAEHLLHAGLRLAMDVLHAEPPAAVSSRVRKDASGSKLAAKVLRWLPAAGYAPPGLFERAAFRLRMRGGLFAAPAYLLRLSFSPTEQDWQAGPGMSNHPLLDALRRPLRLARKYGRRP